MIFLSGMTVSLYAAEFIVVENATAKAGIRLGDKTPGTIFAAKELQKYVKAMSGVELKILATNEVSACSLREVVWTGPAPRLAPFKRLFNGISPVANTAERPKSCIIRVKNSDGSWEALASEFEGVEKEFAPTDCVGVMFASSRKAWLIIEK